MKSFVPSSVCKANTLTHQKDHCDARNKCRRHKGSVEGVTVRVDGTMQVGDVGQTIEVVGTAEALQTDSSWLGAVIGERKVLECR